MKYKNGTEVKFNDTVIGRCDPHGIIAGSVVTINEPDPKVATDVGSIGVNCMRMVRPVTANGKDGAYHAENIKCLASNFVTAEDALAAIVALQVVPAARSTPTESTPEEAAK